MFGGHITNITDHYKLTVAQRKKIRKLIKQNDEIKNLVEQYADIKPRIKTCTAMDDEKLYEEVIKLIEMFDELIEKYKEEDAIQYKAIVQQNDTPQFYLDFMLHNVEAVHDVVKMRNEVLNNILCSGE